MFVNSVTIGMLTLALYLQGTGARLVGYSNGGSKPIAILDKSYPTLTAARKDREDEIIKARHSSKKV